MISSRWEKFLREVTQASRRHLTDAERRDLVEALGLAEDELNLLRDDGCPLQEARRIESTRQLVALIAGAIK